MATRDKNLDESGVDPCLMVDCLGDGQCQLLCSHFPADLSPSARNPAQSRAACTRARRASENRVAKLYARLGQVYQATDTHPFRPSQAEKDWLLATRPSSTATQPRLVFADRREKRGCLHSFRNRSEWKTIPTRARRAGPCSSDGAGCRWKIK